MKFINTTERNDKRETCELCICSKNGDFSTQKVFCKTGDYNWNKRHKK